uniref:Uncharacterized protein n=1 Tax=Anopheles merus TaxID=30066 RepID=A0A182VLK9_ANOME
MGNLLCCRSKKRTKSTGSSSSFNSEYDSQLPWDAEAFHEGHIMRICQKRKRGRKVLHHRIKAGGAYQVPTMELKNKYLPHRHHDHQPEKGHSAGQRKQPHRNGLTATGGRKKAPGNGWVAPNHHLQPPKPQQHHHLPPGVGRKPRTPIRTIVAFGSVEDLRNDDALKRDNGCGYLIYAIMCCI